MDLLKVPNEWNFRKYVARNLDQSDVSLLIDSFRNNGIVHNHPNNPIRIAVRSNYVANPRDDFKHSPEALELDEFAEIQWTDEGRKATIDAFGGQ